MKRFRPWSRSDHSFCDNWSANDRQARYVGVCPITKYPIYTVDGEYPDPRGAVNEKHAAYKFNRYEYEGANRSLTVAWIVANDRELYAKAMELMKK